jgi:AcrR family transcriptional regulator
LDDQAVACKKLGSEQGERMTERHLTSRGLARRQSLTEAALLLIEDRRLEDVLVSDVAEAAGVSRNLFYWYFRDLDDLIGHAIADAIREIRRSLARQMNGLEDPLDRLYVGTRACFLLAVRNPVVKVLLRLVDEGRPLADPHADAVREFSELFFDECVRLLAEAQVQGSVRTDHAALHLAYGVRAVIHYNFTGFHRGEIVGDPEILGDALASFALRGVCADEHQTRQVIARLSSAAAAV